MVDRTQLGVVEFGRVLLETEDLDPLYVILYKSGMKRAQLCRWLVCYFCYYHAGLSCWASEQRKFWATLDRIARAGTEYPRGTERRHFRGKLAIESIQRMREGFSTAEEVVDYWAEGGPTASGVCDRVTSLYGFGEWIKWKVPDVLERLGLARVDFVEDDLDLMFSTSKEGAEEVCEVCRVGGRAVLHSAHRYLLQELGSYKAPPRYERAINVQETETIFCKWHSHRTGHYWPGKDTLDIWEGLGRYRKAKTAQRLLRPLLPLCKRYIP